MKTLCLCLLLLLFSVFKAGAAAIRKLPAKDPAVCLPFVVQLETVAENHCASEPEQQTAIIYVDSSVGEPGNGSSWENAFNYLSDALEAARVDRNITEIRVARGTYFPAGDRNNVDRDSSFVITRAGLRLLGGFPSGGGERDPDFNTTTLSGDAGIQNDTSDNNRCVMWISKIDQSDSLIIDGFEITKGCSDGHYTRFDDNGYRTDAAGGMTIDQAFENTVVKNCRFIENYGVNIAALFIVNSDAPAYLQQLGLPCPQILNCLFKDNIVNWSKLLLSEDGGIMVNVNAAPFVSQCAFTGNTSYFGATITNLGFSKPVFYNCSLKENKAMAFAAVINSGSNSVFINCLIKDNLNTGLGDTDLPEDIKESYSNTMIANATSASLHLINATIVNNRGQGEPATASPLIMNVDKGISYITNSIIWGNQSNRILDTIEGGESGISYSLIQDRTADPASHNLEGVAVGNIFTDSANGDYRLSQNSPAINTGLADSLLSAVQSYIGNTADGGLDLDAKPRIADGFIDMGAFEFQQGALPVTLRSFTGIIQNGIAALVWESGVENGLAYYEVEKSLDTKHFIKIADLRATGSDQQYKYSASQSEALAFYRLKAVDKGGDIQYSNIIKVAQSSTSVSVFAYPIPAKNYLKVQTDKEGNLLIYNSSGSLLKRQRLFAGLNKVDISRLAAGVYYGIIGRQRLQFIKN